MCGDGNAAVATITAAACLVLILASRVTCRWFIGLQDQWTRPDTIGLQCIEERVCAVCVQLSILDIWMCVYVCVCVC